MGNVWDEELARIDYAASFVRDAFNRGLIHPQACVRLLNELDRRRRRYEPDPWDEQRISDREQESGPVIRMPEERPEMPDARASVGRRRSIGAATRHPSAPFELRLVRLAD
jgi:hypothetical protein